MEEFNLPKLDNFKEQLEKQKPVSTKHVKGEYIPKKLSNYYSKNDTADFEERMKKISEVKVYLKQNFHISDINDSFMSNLNELYATSFLEKMNLIANSYNIKKLLNIKSLDKCDFQLSLENVRGKLVKVLHVFPNTLAKQNKKNLSKILSNAEFEKVMQKTSQFTKQTNEDIVKGIKNKDLTKEEAMLFTPNYIDNMFSQAKEILQDKRLYVESKGLIEQQVKGFDLSIENLREKYLKPSNTNVLKITDDVVGKAKFRNFEKVKKNEIVNNKKFEFPFLEIDLNREIVKEVSKPIEVPIEVIMKDIVYILDNFPIDSLIHLDEPINNNSKEDNNFFKNNHIYSSVETNYKKTSEVNHYYRIKTLTKKDVINVYKKIQTPPVYRILGLLINLIYWIMFGFINRIQIDRYSKNFMLNKILGELTLLSDSFKNKTIYHKLFMPIFILIVRIECEAIFTNKFKKLFSREKNLKLALERVNELITTIFDPNSYFSTFTFISSDKDSTVKNKFLPNYKKKINATSNLINQLFTTFKNEKNIIKQMRGEDVQLSQEDIFGHEEWEEEKNYIINNKVEFYKILLKRINDNLKKRNLDPIFKVGNETKRIRNNNFGDSNNSKADYIKEVDEEGYN